MKPNDLIKPTPLCAPCVKEEICGPKAGANIEAGHRLFRRGAWTRGEAEQWNALLDEFINESDLLLAVAMKRKAGP
jgi:hypothetical protein